MWYGLIVGVLILLKALGFISISWVWLLLAAAIPFVMLLVFLASMLGLMFWLDKK